MGTQTSLENVKRLVRTGQQAQHNRICAIIRRNIVRLLYIISADVSISDSAANAPFERKLCGCVEFVLIRNPNGPAGAGKSFYKMITWSTTVSGCFRKAYIGANGLFFAAVITVLIENRTVLDSEERVDFTTIFWLKHVWLPSCFPRRNAIEVVFKFQT